MEADTPDTADLIEPSSAKKANGYQSAEKPPYQYGNFFRWIFNKVHKYFDEVFHAEHNENTGEHKPITIETASENTNVFSTKKTGDTDARHVLKTSGNGLLGGGAATQDIRRMRTAAKSIEWDDNAGGDLTKFSVKAVDSDFSGDINLAPGKSIYAPDVAGDGTPPASANGGRFLGGNGGFMWFDGVTTGVTAITLDSTLDWRDRWISITARIILNTTPSDYVPGGTFDNTLTGYLGKLSGSSAAFVSDFLATTFYSEAGSTGAGVLPMGTLSNLDADFIDIWADSTNGNLKIGKPSDTGDEAAFGLFVIFSDDQEHY